MSDVSEVRVRAQFSHDFLCWVINLSRPFSPYHLPSSQWLCWVPLGSLLAPWLPPALLFVACDADWLSLLISRHVACASACCSSLHVRASHTYSGTLLDFAAAFASVLLQRLCRYSLLAAVMSLILLPPPARGRHPLPACLEFSFLE